MHSLKGKNIQKNNLVFLGFLGFVDILISIKLFGFIFLTGGVLTPPCPTPGDVQWAGLLGILRFL